MQGVMYSYGEDAVVKTEAIKFQYNIFHEINLTIFLTMTRIV